MLLAASRQSALKYLSCGNITVQTSYCKKWHKECRKRGGHPRTGKWGGGFRKGACGRVAGVRRNLPRREPRPGGVPVEAALAASRDIRTGSSNVAAVFTRRPDGGGAFPFGRLFPTAHRICNLQSARMVMDSNQKTIKGAQSVYRVLNILEEVILCGDRMITPKS